MLYRTSFFWIGEVVEGELMTTPALTVLVLNRDLLTVEPVEIKCQTVYDSAVDRRKYHAGRIMRKERLDTCCKKKTVGRSK
jgi:hypothetical protein